MATCPNGAEVKPGYTLTNVVLSIAEAGLLAITGLEEMAPWAFSQPMIGSIGASALCSLNLSDPGDFNISLLTTPSWSGEIPNPNATPGSLPRWIWDKTAYFFFQQTCQCIGATPPPPPPVTITPITNYDTSVSLQENQSQISVVINNQNTGADAQKQLYNMLQQGNSLLGDLWIRNVPNLMQDTYNARLGITGEGTFDLSGSNAEYPPWFSTRTTWLKIRVTQISSKVGIRGSLNPRLYGVGSLMFMSRQRVSEPPLINGRHSIHYYQDICMLPKDQIVDSIAYRIMPGCVVDIMEGSTSTDDVQFSPTANTQYGWLPYGAAIPPPGWTDPPIYPSPARRIFPVAGGSGDLLRLDSVPLTVPEQINTGVATDPKGCGCPGSV